MSNCPESTSRAIKLQPAFCTGKRPSSRGTGSFGEMTEKICATTNAVFLAEAERYSPKEGSKNRCDPQVIYSPPIATNRPPTGGVFILQVNERVALLWPGKVVHGRRSRSLCWLVDRVSNFLVGGVHGT
jgi:hypothetical protein